MSDGEKRTLSRRDVLRLGAGGGLYASVGFGLKMPDKLIPFLIPPEQAAPEASTYFASTCRECPAGCGLRLLVRENRVTKAEGTPGHPVNDGGLCPRGQSVVQGQYDPDRLRAPLRRTDKGQRAATWAEALSELATTLRKPGGRTFVLSRLETGTMAGTMNAFARASGGRALFWEPFSHAPLIQAHKDVFGQAAIPGYRIDECEFLLGFGAQFLETWVSNVEFTRMFRLMRGRGGNPGRYAHVGPHFSLTAANADLFVNVPAGSESDVALAVLKVILDNGWARPGSQSLAPLVANVRPDALPLPEAGRKIEWLARAFASSKASLALPGPMGGLGPEAYRLGLAVALLNKACGREDRTLDFSRTHALSRAASDADLEALLSELTPADTLIVHQSNPAFTRPGLAGKLRRAGTMVSLTVLPDETSELSDWVLPLDSPLESWGDYEPWTGLTCLQQPVMARLHDTRSAGEIVLGLAAGAGVPLGSKGDTGTADFRSRLEASWSGLLGATPGEDAFEPARQEALRRGFVTRPPQAASGASKSAASPGPLPVLPPRPPESAQDASRLHLVAWPSIYLYDGSLANRGWLQEISDPVSGLAWGNWLDIHPETAARLGIRQDDLVEVGSGSGTIRVPARLSDQVAGNAVAVGLGQGHAALGKIARGVGGNAFALLSSSQPDRLFAAVSVKRVGQAHPVSPLATQDQHGRELLRWTGQEELAAGKASDEITLPLPAGYKRTRDLEGGHEHAAHRWAMAVDLDRCIGCGACRVACYAENNIPVVGPTAVTKGREMAWLRIVAYRHPEQPGRLGFLPLTCQHCDAAPCEPVCPVFASVNNEEGLNSQIYNRCIGTRYCAQNCPYKVRKFNWIDGEFKSPLHWQLNPEVTVRVRGVMEKCTFCVQRIRAAEYQAKLEDRPVRDGEVVPACVQTCPAKVFTFGNMKDETSEISRLFRSAPRRYQLLHELNTKPAVLFLKRVHDEALAKAWEARA